MRTYYFVSAKKRDLAPIYIRLSAGRGTDLIVKSGLLVDPKRWSNKTQTIKQRITTDEDDKLIVKLKLLKSLIEDEFKNKQSDYSKEWLEAIIYQFHNKKVITATDLNSYIDIFINEAEAGQRKNKSGLNIAPGTINILKGFKRIFNEYQGIYTDERLEWRQKNDKPIRKKHLLSYEDITIDFYNSFVNFLSDEGYALNTQGRFIKGLKMMMKKSIQEKLHHNSEFQYEAFRGISEKTKAIYLTQDEIEKLYNKDLHKYPKIDKARDAFIVLCETCLRISDYSKIEVNIRTINGKRFIDIMQTKTGSQVIIPLTPRFEAIYKKHSNGLPKIPEQYVNKLIKNVAFECGLTEVINWEAVKFGKRFPQSAQKWELISCHSGRRSACTNMYLAGIPLKDIREISGHSSDKQLLEYIRVTKEETALRLADHPYYSGNNLKVV